MKTTTQEKSGIVIFLIPGLLLFTLFFIIPIIFNLVTSFLKWDGVSPAIYIGINNYFAIFRDEVFRRSILNNVIWALAAGLIQVPLALIMALILGNKPRGWKFFRTIYFLPQVISGIALATMWAAIYNSEYGLLNALIKLFGGGDLKTNWLGNLKTAFPAILIYGLFYIGYYMVVMLADITSIDESYYEAAEIDGTSKFQQAIYITLPLVKGSIVACITLAMVYGLRTFEQVYLLTNGGPANRTSVMVLYLYSKLQISSYGMASSTSVVLIIVGTIVIVGVRKLLGNNDDSMGGK